MHRDTMIIGGVLLFLIVGLPLIVYFSFQDRFTYVDCPACDGYGTYQTESESPMGAGLVMITIYTHTCRSCRGDCLVNLNRARKIAKKTGKPLKETKTAKQKKTENKAAEPEKKVVKKKATGEIVSDQLAAQTPQTAVARPHSGPMNLNKPSTTKAKIEKPRGSNLDDLIMAKPEPGKPTVKTAGTAKTAHAPATEGDQEALRKAAKKKEKKKLEKKYAYYKKAMKSIKSKFSEMDTKIRNFDLQINNTEDSETRKRNYGYMKKYQDEKKVVCSKMITKIGSEIYKLERRRSKHADKLVEKLESYRKELYVLKRSSAVKAKKKSTAY